MKNKKYRLGIIGLGTMGKNLLLNMADSGFHVVGYDKDLSKVKALETEAAAYTVFAAKSKKSFLDALKKPRAIFLSVPAGKVVDIVIKDLLPHLSKGDIIIDGGNSYFKETTRRQNLLKEKGIHFIGLGVSGGSKGARLGPSMMPGGNKAAYNKVADILEAIAAKVGTSPCIAYLGKGAVGHYVKMVHNGIEYGLMQLIAEAYDLLKRGLGYDNKKIAALFDEWNKGDLQSYLIEITAKIFAKENPGSSKQIIDLILDASRSKGTGKWTSQDAMNLGAAVPIIDMAVVMRYLSAYQTERLKASKKLKEPTNVIKVKNKKVFTEQIRQALHFSFILTYAQGMDQLRKASDEYDFDVDLETIASIWRGGCIIRAALLEQFRKAYRRNPNLPNLMMDTTLSKILLAAENNTRKVISTAVQAAIPIPAMMVGLSYFDAYRSKRLPANLIQAQRDFFGSHTYERIDKKGSFHTEW